MTLLVYTVTQQVHFLLKTSAVAVISFFSTWPSRILPPLPMP